MTIQGKSPKEGATDFVEKFLPIMTHGESNRKLTLDRPGPNCCRPLRLGEIIVGPVRRLILEPGPAQADLVGHIVHSFQVEVIGNIWQLETVLPRIFQPYDMSGSTKMVIG